MKKLYLTAIAFAGILPFAISCASHPAEDVGDEAAPEVDSDGLQTTGTITYGGWTITANQPGKYFVNAPPVPPYYAVWGKATFSGSGTVGAGACLLTRSNTWPTCNSESDCTNYPVALPSGGARYCKPINDSGPSYCWYRGAASTWCLGMPKTGQPIAAGSYSTGSVAGYNNTSFMTLACISMCDGQTTSSATQVF